MSDVAAGPVPSTNNDNEKPPASPTTSTSPDSPAKDDPPGDPEPSTITNGPAGEHLQTDLGPHPDADETQAAEGARDRDQESSADKEDEELYGIEGRAEGDADKPDHEATGKDDQSDDDPFAGLDDVATMDLYDLTNYTFGKKNEESKSRIMQELPKGELSAALEKRYAERGMRRSVGAVLLVHSHNFPHILLLQRSDGKGEYALPGGRLRPGESDEEGLQRKLTSKLRPTGSVSGEEEEQQQLDVGDKRTISYLTSILKPSVLTIASSLLLLSTLEILTALVSLRLGSVRILNSVCTWHAIDFTRKYYPYVPVHVTKPKEVLNVYSVSLPSKFMFAVPNNLQLVAVPLFELFNNAKTYGDIISTVPALLSRYHVNYC